MKLFSSIRSIFTLDLRALALMRIGIGSIIFLDLCIRITDLKAHYSDEGLLPLELLFRREWNSWNISLHTISGLWQIQLLFFLIAGFFSILLIIGYKTKAVTLISWILLLSLHNRNPLILQGGDDVLRMTLFWGIFLPWEKYYSIDKINSGENPNTTSWFGIAGVGYILQIASVYFFSALIKAPSPEWTTEGSAIYYALSLDQMVFPLGKLIYPHYSLLRAMTFFVFYLELFTPVLLLTPLLNPFFRKTCILLLIALHIGIASTLFVGLFFMIGIITLIGLFPAEWIDTFETKFKFLPPLLPALGKKTGKAFDTLFFIRSNFKSNDLTDAIKKTFLCLVIIYCLLWNWQTTTFSNYKIEGTPNGIAQLIGINQNWGMFAPNVFKDDGWFIYEAKNKNDSLIDIGNDGKPVTYSKPESVVSSFKNDRWRKYCENCLFISNSDLRLYYSDMLMHAWNSGHSDNQIKELKIIYMKEVSQFGYKLSAPTKEILCIENCGDE